MSAILNAAVSARKGRPGEEHAFEMTTVLSALAAADSEYSQARLSLVHPPQLGRVSSHLTLRFLHTRHPVLDFVCPFRGIGRRLIHLGELLLGADDDSPVDGDGSVVSAAMVRSMLRRSSLREWVCGRSKHRCRDNWRSSCRFFAKVSFKGLESGEMVALSRLRKSKREGIDGRVFVRHLRSD